MRNSIKELRKAKDVTQAELAAAVGVTRQTVISIELDRYTPGLGLAIDLAQFFGKPVEEVFHRHADEDD